VGGSRSGSLKAQKKKGNELTRVGEKNKIVLNTREKRKQIGERGMYFSFEKEPTYLESERSRGVKRRSKKRCLGLGGLIRIVTLTIF